MFERKVREYAFTALTYLLLIMSCIFCYHVDRCVVAREALQPQQPQSIYIVSRASEVSSGVAADLLSTIAPN